MRRGRYALRAAASARLSSSRAHRLQPTLWFKIVLLSSCLAGQLAFGALSSFPRGTLRTRDRCSVILRAEHSPGPEGLWSARPQDREMTSAEMQLRFERNGFCHVPSFLTVPEASSLAQELAHVQSLEICEMAALQHELRQHVAPALARSCRTTQDCKQMLQKYERSGKVKFLQYFNLHRHSDLLRRAALSPRLALWAARLLGVSQVRLYQDALFMKYPRHGPTRWHSDLALAPFDTNAFVTVWLALTPVPAKGGAGLRFAQGSHRDYTLQYHSDLADSYTQDDLSSRYRIAEGTDLQPGDATWHHGWTLHAASPLDRSARSPRVAWAISFVASDARILPEESLSIVQEAEDSVSFRPWIGKLRPGGRAEHAMLMPNKGWLKELAAMNFFLSNRGDLNQRMGALAKLSKHSAQSDRAVETLFKALDGAMRRHEHALVWSVLNSLSILVSSASCCQMLFTAGFIPLLHRVLEVYTAFSGILPKALARRDEKLKTMTQKAPEFVSTFKPSAIQRNPETLKEWWLKKSVSLPELPETGSAPRRPSIA
ncbi:htxA, partial [Symbiodinium sp. CCMP2456]